MFCRRLLSQKSQGFSLLEALVVLALIGLVSSVGLGYWPGNSKQYDRRGFAEKLRTELVGHRAQAIRSRSTVAVEVESFCHDEVLTVLFFADGSATPMTICPSRGHEGEKLVIDGLLGSVAVVFD